VVSPEEVVHSEAVDWVDVHDIRHSRHFFGPGNALKEVVCIGFRRCSLADIIWGAKSACKGQKRGPFLRNIQCVRRLLW
jgi:hypothetical protein